MTASKKYRAAIAADSAINALDRDPTDDETLAAEAIVADAYRTAPGSAAEIADFASMVLTIEGVTLEPTVAGALGLVRGCARSLARLGA